MNTNFELPDRDSNYIANSLLISQIKNELTKNKKCYVYGVPGVGKSSLAIELAHELTETHWAIWFDCALESKVKESIQRLANVLSISSNDIHITWWKIKNNLCHFLVR